MEGEWSRRGLIHVCFIVSRALSIRSIGMVEKRHANSSFTGIRCVCVWGGGLWVRTCLHWDDD